MSSAGDRLAATGTGLLFVLYFVLGIAQLLAFMQGLTTIFGIAGWISIIVFAIMMMGGAFLALPIAIIGFIGAWKGWHWEWWQAALLCFPFLILSLFMMLGLGLTSVFSARR